MKRIETSVLKCCDIDAMETKSVTCFIGEQSGRISVVFCCQILSIGTSLFVEENQSIPLLPKAMQVNIIINVYDRASALRSIMFGILVA